jgi:hypothetical protein
LKATYQRYRVVFTFEARDEREAIQLVSCPDVMLKEAQMRVECVGRRVDLGRALLLGPLVASAILIGYQWAEAWWNW